MAIEGDRSATRTGARRFILPAIAIVAWLAVLLVGGRMFSQLNDLSTNDRVQFLPRSAESTQVHRVQEAFSIEGVTYAVVVFEADRPIDRALQSRLERAVSRLDPIEGVHRHQSTPLIVADDELAAEMVVPITAAGEIDEAVAALQAGLDATVPEGVSVYLTGPAGFTADIIRAFAGIDGLLLLVALGAVLLILIVVYRSALLPLIVLATSLSALCGAILVVSALARADRILLAGQTQGILLILVVGATTNYALLYISRYREALREHESTWTATRQALGRSWQPILASGATVVVALLVLLLSQLDSNRTLGPIASIGIVFALLASFTLLPVLLLWAGRRAFWPRRVVPTAATGEEGLTDTRNLWARLARVIAARARIVWVLTALALVVLSLGLTQLRADGAPSSEYVMGDSPARTGLAVIAEHYPAGAGTPAIVVVDTPRMLDAVATLLAVPGVDSARIATLSGPAPITATGIKPFAAGAGIPPAPVVIDDQVMLEITLTDAADSAAAERTLRQMRDALDAVGTDVLVGGSTAVNVDSHDAATIDRTLIIPLVLVAVLLVLIVLLRALLAPLLLVATVALSFAAALGVSALVFTHVFGFTGADPTVPLFSFVFLIALGVDYNIFLVTRAREEAVRHGTRVGVLRALVLTGGVITSAGLVLAATFAALGVLPLLFMAQIAFIVAFGVLLDTFVVRTLLVPALLHDIGAAVWWPSRLARGMPGPPRASSPEPGVTAAPREPRAAVVGG